MYKLLSGTELGLPNCVKRLADNAFIPVDPANSDYQAYLAWVEVGNTPEPADVPGESEALAACKAEAKHRLQDTDFSEVDDVAAILSNKSAFDTYRAAVRALYIDPVAEPTWPERPVAVWTL